MNKTSPITYIRISKDEYRRLKALQAHFDAFWKYFTQLKDIEEGRRQIKAGKTISQEKLFRKLHL